MGFHKKHRKEAVATKVNRERRVHRWLLKLDRICFAIELKRKDKK
jgi:hypothetical protein